MKKYILLPLAAIIAISTFSSYENGTIAFGYNGTGANGSIPTCGGSSCHPGSTGANIATSIILTDDQNNTVANGKYIPGKTYKVTLRGNNGLGGNFPVFGFQFTVGNPPNDGTLILVGNDLKSTVYGYYEFIEQKAPLLTNGNISETYFYWKAPAAGAGTITFYATLLVGNGDHTTNGDREGHAIVSFTEAVSTAVPKPIVSLNMQLFPNPTTDQLTVTFSPTLNKEYSIQVMDITNRVLYKNTLKTNKETITTSIPTSNFSSGTYWVTIGDGTNKQVEKFIKL